MLVSIKDFSEERNVDNDTVNAYLRNHPEIKQHTKRVRKNIVIDTESEAYALLEKQYPLPQMIQVVEDTESREKLLQAQELIIQLQKKINEQSQLIAQAEATKMLLEDKQVQLEKMEAEKADLQKQLDAERSKTWWQKLRGKQYTKDNKGNT